MIEYGICQVPRSLHELYPIWPRAAGVAVAGYEGGEERGHQDLTAVGDSRAECRDSAPLAPKQPLMNRNNI